MKRLSLKTPLATLDRLWKLAERQRATVPVPRELLVNLLMDHSTLAEALQFGMIDVRETPRKRLGDRSTP